MEVASRERMAIMRCEKNAISGQGGRKQGAREAHAEEKGKGVCARG
jgi:hypothetical protein